MSRKHFSKQNATVKEKLEKDILTFLEAHKKEAESRYNALINKSEEIYLRIREDFMKTAESILPLDVLDANLFDFVNDKAAPNNSLMEVQEEDGTSENMIDISSDAVAAFENLSIPVDRTYKQNGLQEVEAVRTPLQQNMAVTNLPSVIRPKIGDVKGRNFRVAKGNEVAFSIDGSPIVVLPTSSTDQSTLLMKQIIESEEDAFSPNSREVVSMFKSLMRKKMAETQSEDHPQELD
ncbi:hypothetical protein V3C99_014630 [Haemonchus contortus]